MKHTYDIYRHLLAALLLLVGSQSLSAQDAFYVYRNDGEFNGFFYDDIVRMGVSKYDLDSIEHEEYVVQDIETADSIYRIPLAAIDSIGFQQPEIVLNPKAKDIGAQGLYDYMKDFYAYDDMTVFFRLNADTPAELVPKEGDVLINFSDPRISYSMQSEEDFSGLACKVKSVIRYNEYSQWTVYCDPLTDLSDIFVQLIAVEKIGYDTEGNVKRRIAGFDYDEETQRYVAKASGSGSITLFDISATLHRESDWGTANADLSIKAGLDVTYNITWKNIYFKLGRSFEFSVTPSATLKASKDFEAEIVGIPEFLSSIKFPAVAPLFQTRPFPKVVLRAGGELGVKLSLPTVGYAYHESLSFNSGRILPWSYSMFDGNTGSTNPNQELFNTGDVELSLSGFVQIAAKFTGGVETNDWFSKILSAYIGLELYAGPKLEGSLSLSMSKLLQQGAYESMSDSKISFHPISLDLAAKANVKLFWNDPEETTFFEASKQFGSYDLYLFPSFKDTQATYSSKSGAVQCSTTAERSVFWKSELGFGAYLNGELKESVFPTNCRLGSPAKGYTGRFESLTPGRYQIMPMVRTVGIDLPVQSQAQEVVVTPYLRVSPRDFEVDGSGGEFEISAETNAERLSIGGEGGIWSAETSDKKIQLKVEQNNSLLPRKRDIRILAESSVGFSADSVSFTQKGNNGENISTISVELSSLSFLMVDKTKDYKLGPQIYGSSIPCTATRNGDLITVTGSFSSTYISKEWDDTLLDGDITESVELTIDASGMDGNTPTGICKVISGKASFLEHVKTPIIGDPETGEATGRGSTIGYGTTTSSWEINIGEMEMSEGHQFFNYDKHVYKAKALPTSFVYKIEYPNTPVQVITQNEWKNAEVEVVLNREY